MSLISMLAYSFYFNLSGISEQMMAVNTDPQSVMKALFNPVLMVLGLVYTVTSLVTIIFCLLDGRPESNKYGKSPKYIINEEEQCGGLNQSTPRIALFYAKRRIFKTSISI